MRNPGFSEGSWVWDRYKEPHVVQGNVVYFRTGEVIVTTNHTDIDERHTFPGDLRLASTAGTGPLWTPDGMELPNAWLYDNGMQHLLVDEENNRAVSIQGQLRYRNSDGTVYNNHSTKAPIPFIHGIPERFQAGAYAYIGGRGCLSIGTGKIVAWALHRKVLTPEQLEHVQMIETTARAAMKLTGAPQIDNTPSWGHTTNPPINKGCPLDIILKCETWQDIPTSQLCNLWHGGVQRAKLEFDWCYWDAPR